MLKVFPKQKILSLNPQSLWTQHPKIPRKGKMSRIGDQAKKSLKMSLEMTKLALPLIQKKKKQYWLEKWQRHLLCMLLLEGQVASRARKSLAWLNR